MYKKTIWENNVTPLNSDNMNKIEDELESQSIKLDTIPDDIAPDNIGTLYDEDLNEIQKVQYKSLNVKDIVFKTGTKAFNGIVNLNRLGVADAENRAYFVSDGYPYYYPNFSGDIPPDIFKPYGDSEKLDNHINNYGYSAAGFTDTQAGKLQSLKIGERSYAMGAVFLYRCFTKSTVVKPNTDYEFSFDFAIPNGAPFNWKDEYATLPFMNNLVICGEYDETVQPPANPLDNPLKGRTVSYKQVGATYQIDKDKYTAIPTALWFPKSAEETYDKVSKKFKTFKFRFNSGTSNILHICFAYELGDKVNVDYSKIPMLAFKNFSLLEKNNNDAEQFTCTIESDLYQNNIKPGDKFYFKRGTVIDTGTQKLKYTSSNYFTEFGKII